MRNIKMMATLGAFYTFFVFGFSDNIKGSILPVVFSDLNISYAVGANIILAIYLGFMLSTLVAGVLAKRYGHRTVLITASLLLASGFLLFSRSSLPVFLGLGLLSTGLAYGSIEVSSNGIISDLFPQKKGRLLNLLAFCHGIGAMVGPMITGIVLDYQVSWRMVISIYTVLPVLMLVIWIVNPIQAKSSVETSDKQTADFLASFKRVITWRTIVLAFYIFFYVSVEAGISTWISDYVQKTYAFSIVKGASYIGIYFGLMTLGRLIGSFIVDQVGLMKVLVIATLLSCMVLVIGIYAPVEFLIFIPVTGLFFSVLFPTTAALVADLHPRDVPTAFSVVFFFAGLGGMFGPWLIGTVADIKGISVGFSLNILYILGMLLCVAVWRIIKAPREA